MSDLAKDSEKIASNKTKSGETVQCFTFNNFGLDIVVETVGKKVTCISCLKMFDRISLHWYKSLKCANAVDKDKFEEAYKEHRKEELRLRNNIKCKKYADKQKAKDGTWKEKERKRKATYRENLRLEDDQLVKEKERKMKRQQRLSRKKFKSNLFTENLVPGEEKCDRRPQEKLTRLQRLKMFKHAVKFGAIFICSCCHQRLFQNGVTKITDTTRSLIEGKKFGLFDAAIKEVVQNIGGKLESYLCHTCKRTLTRGKMPSMSVENGLTLRKISNPDMKLSEIENSLIAQNIIFQKIFLLPKSRMSAVKDRLVNVPVRPNDIINTIQCIPRTPKEAGLIQVKLKRKLKYKNYHKQ